MLCHPVQAIVTANVALSESDPADVSAYASFDWNYVFRVGGVSGASGVAVGPFWVLTAKHVTQGNITHNGVVYTWKQTVAHPDADLRLVRYNRAFNGWYPIYTGTIPVPPPSNIKKRTGLMVGYGRSGNVLSDKTYEWHGSETAGTKRWGDSLIDSTGSQSDIGDYFVLNFNTNATTYAAGAADKDSGGGVFVQQDGVWYLAGTLVSVTGQSGAYTGSVAVDLRSYAEWIAKVTDPEKDYDGDGYSDWEEYIADTDPTDAGSYPRIADIEATAEQQTVFFNGSTGRVYQLFYTTNDLAEVGWSWQMAHDEPVAGIGPTSSITVSNIADKAFFRLEVALPSSE